MVSLKDELNSNLKISIADIINYSKSDEIDGNGRRLHDYYLTKSLPKKSGGSRTVYLPAPQIKTIQRYICERYLSKIAISQSSTAYGKGCSVKKNATLHEKNSHFLFVDVKNFFDSLDFGILEKALTNDLKEFLSKDDVDLLLKLCSRKGIFVQGCVSSPILANIYMRDADTAISAIVSKLKSGVYSRYSDDITISSCEKIPDKTLSEVIKELSFVKLEINPSKTYYSSYLQKIDVTGIRIFDSKSTGLCTKKKKEIKNAIYHVLNNQFANSDEIRRVQGLLSYLKMADPRYYNVVNLKYEGDGLTLEERLKKLSKLKHQNTKQLTQK